MTPWNHALRVSFVCSKAWVVLPLLLFCRYCCNSDGRFATLFEICGYDCCDSSIEICLARQRIYLVLRRGCWGRARNPGSWLFWTADTWPVTFDVGKVWLAVTNPGCGGGRAVGTTTPTCGMPFFKTFFKTARLSSTLGHPIPTPKAKRKNQI